MNTPDLRAQVIEELKRMAQKHRRSTPNHVIRIDRLGHELAVRIYQTKWVPPGRVDGVLRMLRKERRLNTHLRHGNYYVPLRSPLLEAPPHVLDP